MALTSKLFRDNKQLQDCSRIDPAHIVANEPPFRRGVNDKGPHVGLIQTALRRVMGNVSFGLEEATETYGPKTAEIVRQFKAAHKPPILNKALTGKLLVFRGTRCHWIAKVEIDRGIIWQGL